jgi:hyaluronan synthase
MDEFMHGRFLGVFLEISDDRTLTNLALKQGYRTVYQSTSLVFTDAPVTVRKLYKQQLRWARGSQYNTLRMLPWMVRRTPVLAVFFVSDIVLPFLLLGAVVGAVERAMNGTGVNYYSAYLREYGFGFGLGAVVVLTVLSSGLSMAIRQLRHLEEVPGDWWRMPAFVLFSSMFLMPIRLIGFFRMAHVAGWGTRRDAYSGMQDDVIAELERATTPAPTDIVDREPTTSGVVPHTAAGATPAATGAGTQVREHPEEADPRPGDGGYQTVNALAAVPYLIGGILIVLEVLYRG